MDLFKIAIFALASVVLIEILKQHNKTYAIAASIVATILIVIYSIQAFIPALDYINQLVNISQVSDFSCIIKSIGLGLLAQTSADICIESGQHALASKVILAGKIAIVFVCLPLFKTLVEIIEGFLI